MNERMIRRAILSWTPCLGERKRNTIRWERSSNKYRAYFRRNFWQYMYVWHELVRKHRIVLAIMKRKDREVQREAFAVLQEQWQSKYILRLRRVQIFVSTAIRMIRFFFAGWAQSVALRRRRTNILISRTVKFQRMRAEFVIDVFKANA